MVGAKNANDGQKSLIRWFLLIILVLLLSLYISKYWYQFMLIQGNSMEPAYHHLQLVIINKHTRDFRNGDVVVFRSQNLSSVLVKRIVAGMGDTVVIQNGILLVNGKKSDLYGESPFDYSGILESELVLSKGEYIVIGDNIAQSKDSRYREIGIVKEDSIIGTIIKTGR